MSTEPLTDAEASRILEEMARDEANSAGARVTAIRTLREIGAAEPEPEDQAAADAFAELYDGNTPARPHGLSR